MSDIKSNQDKQKIKVLSMIYPFVVVGVALLVSLFWLANQLSLPLSSLISNITNNFYSVHHNVCPWGKVAHVHLGIYIYGIILVSLALILTIRLLLIIVKKEKDLQYPFDIMPACITIIFFLIITAQTIKHTQIFSKEIKRFHGKTTEEKINNIPVYRLPFNFAVYCRKLLPGRHKGKFITDQDTGKDPFMLQHRALSYYLYPVIDLRIDKKRSFDCLVFFLKQNPSEDLPEDFESLGAFDPFCLLAVKKEAK